MDFFIVEIQLAKYALHCNFIFNTFIIFIALALDMQSFSKHSKDLTISLGNGIISPDLAIDLYSYLQGYSLRETWLPWL